ncbi:hypothetical protein GpartN1_g1989.t1 [Galdieria partita]|uniref:LisH domain-containing protein n=1 Tax=Galdieria partita TaxID=83374 RepID=A0A9C7PT10_9RHOD|nr:hypothetical protein GpartN1_g1989.t1 [Galdieria partita]
MEHCDCYKKELVELFIKFLKREGLTCTLSVFKTEIMSLQGAHSFASNYSQYNELSRERAQTEDNKLKRPRSPTSQENIQPNTVSNWEVNEISSPGSRNVSDSRMTEAVKKQRIETLPKSEGPAGQTDRNLSNVATVAQGVTKTSAFKSCSDLNHGSKQYNLLPDRSQSSRVVAFNLSQRSRDTNNSEKDHKKKMILEPKSRHNGSFEESIRNVTESLRYDPSFQENLRNILRSDNLSMGLLPLSQNNSESLQEVSDVLVQENKTNAVDKLRKLGDFKDNEVAGTMDSVVDSSIGGVLETIDLDAFLGSIHAASNH